MARYIFDLTGLLPSTAGYKSYKAPVVDALVTLSFYNSIGPSLIPLEAWAYTMGMAALLTIKVQQTEGEACQHPTLSINIQKRYIYRRAGQAHRLSVNL